MADDILDPAATYTALRASTIALLGLDPAKLSLTQDLQVDLLSLLRLEVDGLQGRVLAGADVDLNRLAAAVTMLQKLLPPAELKADSKPDFDDAREELTRFLQARADAARDARLVAAQAEALRQPPPQLPRPPQSTSPAPPAHVAYVDYSVIGDRDEPSMPAPQQKPSDAEWSRWYRDGGGNVRQPGWDSVPKNF